MNLFCDKSGPVSSNAARMYVEYAMDITGSEHDSERKLFDLEKLLEKVHVD